MCLRLYVNLRSTFDTNCRRMETCDENPTDITSSEINDVRRYFDIKKSDTNSSECDRPIAWGSPGDISTPVLCNLLRHKIPPSE